MKDFNLKKYLLNNPLTSKNKSKINEAFEGFGGVKGLGVTGNATPFAESEKDNDSLKEYNEATMTVAKGLQYDYKKDAMERIEGLVDQRELNKFKEAAMMIAQDLDDNGFEQDEVRDFLRNALEDSMFGTFGPRRR